MAHVEKTFIVSLNTKLVPDWNEKRDRGRAGPHAADQPGSQYYGWRASGE